MGVLCHEHTYRHKAGLSLRFRELAYIRLRVLNFVVRYDYRSNLGCQLYARRMRYALISPYAEQ